MATTRGGDRTDRSAPGNTPSGDPNRQPRSAGSGDRVGLDGGNVSEEPTRVASTGEGSRGTNATVLVVDDERGFADAVALWLEDNYDVRVAYDGEEALEAYGPAVDVVLLDRRMPNLDGDETLGRLRERDGDARVAMLTASELSFDAADLPFDAYLQKPVDEADVVDAVERLSRWNAYPDPLAEYLSVLSRLSELERTHPSSQLEGNDQCEALEARLDDLRPDATNALSSLSSDERRMLREYVTRLAYPADLFD